MICCHKYSNVITPEGTLGLVLVKKKDEKKKKIKRRKKKGIFPLFLDYYALFFNIFSFLSCLKKSLVLKGANCHCQLTYQIN